MNYFNRLIKAIKWLHREHSIINKKYKVGKSNVKLGRSFPLGSLFGYHFAKNMFEYTKYDVVVDAAIKLNNRKQPLYPDIILIKNNVLKAIIELKIDLGFLRLDEFGISYNKKIKDYSYKKSKNKFLSKQNEIKKAKFFTYKTKDQYGKVLEFKEIKINKSFNKMVITISKKNDHGRTEYFKKAMKDSGYRTLFILTNTHARPEFEWEKIKKEMIDNKRRINQFFKVI